jgi:seryl-tRNA synthetase
MIDIKILRSNPELVRDSITKRNISVNLDRLLELDQVRLDIQKELNDLQALRNKTSKEIPSIKDQAEKQEKMTSMRAV